MSKDIIGSWWNNGKTSKTQSKEKVVRESSFSRMKRVNKEKNKKLEQTRKEEE
tara:strand:+ start:235 stop:393 length:159 start_codon:yes stop_codon:yes gene_type:complete